MCCPSAGCAPVARQHGWDASLADRNYADRFSFPSCLIRQALGRGEHEHMIKDVHRALVEQTDEAWSALELCFSQPIRCAGYLGVRAAAGQRHQDRVCTPTCSSMLTLLLL